jgi:addiction module HigA family antidote
MTKHPGKILQEQFMRPLGVSASQLAKYLGINRSTLGRFLAGEQRLTLEMAARLGACFDSPARWWLQMQTDFDVTQIDAHPKWKKRVTPLTLPPSMLVTPKGILDLGEPGQNKEQQGNPSEAAKTKATLVRYENGAVALVGETR